MLFARLHAVLAGTRRLMAAVVIVVAALPAPSALGDDRTARLAGFRRADAIPFPPGNPYTPEKSALGRMLFFDPILSASGTISCASCHNPGLSWGDALPLAIGEGRRPLAFRSPTVLGLAWGTIFGWDGKFRDLESVAFVALSASANMNRDPDELVAALSAIPGYRDAFAAAEPGGGVTRGGIERALATYQRTILPGEAPFDRWVRGDESAVPEAAKRGFDLFTGRAGCTGCHAGWRFTDDAFHDVGAGAPGDMGRGRLFPRSVALRHAFKTPTLRDVAHRAPYMHDGSLPTLDAVVALYDRGGVERPSRDVLVRALGLSASERRDLVAFLDTLTAAQTEVPVPVLPR